MIQRYDIYSTGGDEYACGWQADKDNENGDWCKWEDVEDLIGAHKGLFEQLRIAEEELDELRRKVAEHDGFMIDLNEVVHQLESESLSDCNE